MNHNDNNNDNNGNVRSHFQTVRSSQSNGSHSSSSNRHRHMHASPNTITTANAPSSATSHDNHTTSDEDWVQWYESIYTPIEWVSLAVQFDATTTTTTTTTDNDVDAEQRLKEPLESGRWYNDAEPFRRAMDRILQKFPTGKNNFPMVTHITTNTSRQQTTTTTTKNHPKNNALTPIILSGWMANYDHQQQQRQQQQLNSSALDLLSTCQGLRRVALARLQRQRRRRKFFRIWMIALVAVLAVAWLEHSAATWRTTILQVGGIIVDTDEGGCWEFSPAYYDACRTAEIHWLVKSLHNAADAAPVVHIPDTSRKTTTTNSVPEKDTIKSIHIPADDFFRLHTILYRQLITRDELYKSSSPIHGPPPSLLPPRESSSPVNQIVMNVLQKHGPVQNRSSDHVVLDVGCGAGSFLDHYFRHHDSNPDSFVIRRYHGISASLSEIIVARRLFQQQHHQILQKQQQQRIERGASNLNVTFDRISFDTILPSQTYTAIIAVESLSFSRNLENTLHNLVQSLQSGGIMVIVEDVAYAGTEEQEGNDLSSVVRPSLVSHATWMTMLESRLCRVVVARDLSLEYEPIIQVLSLSSPLSTSRSWFPFPSFLFGGSFIAAGWKWWLNAPVEFWRASRGDKAAQRLIELVQADHPLYRSLQKSRQEGYQSARLSYNLYACIKQ
jgi:SAM-dependent methyltransferase